MNNPVGYAWVVSYIVYISKLANDVFIVIFTIIIHFQSCPVSMYYVQSNAVFI